MKHHVLLHQIEVVDYARRFGIFEGSDLTYFGQPYLENYSIENFQILTRSVFEYQLQKTLNEPFPKISVSVTPQFCFSSLIILIMCFSEATVRDAKLNVP